MCSSALTLDQSFPDLNHDLEQRLRIASCGIMDVLMYDTPSHDMHVLQQEDLLSFGRLIFALCCNNPSATSGGNFQKSLEVMARLYSPDMKAAALFLISKPSHNRVCFDD